MLLVTDFRTDGAGKKKKRGMGERSGEGEGDGERGVWSGRDFMDWRWGRSEGAFDGRVWVFWSGTRWAARGAVALPGLGSLDWVVVAEVTSDWLKVKTGLWWDKGEGQIDGKGREEKWKNGQRNGYESYEL